MYARGRQDPALWHVGMVRAASVEDAEVFAVTTFDEQTWAELVVVPRAAVLSAVPAE